MALTHNRKIAVIGLGYVGLPVAVAFARAGAPVIGFDIDKARIEELRAGHDRTHEVERNDLDHKSLVYAHDASALKAADFFIVTVPTPIDSANRPDLGAMLAASRTVGGMLEKGDIVRHATWGHGEVVRVVGDSVMAFFPGHGEKLLKTSFLERVAKA